MPAVLTVLAIQIQKTIVVLIFRKHPVVCVLDRITSKLSGPEFLSDIASACYYHSAASICRLFRNHVDDPIHRIGAPDSSSRTTNYFDSRNVFQRHVLRVPVNATEKRRVNRSTIDKHKQFVRELKIESSRTDSPSVAIDLRHIQARHHAKQVGDVGCA